MNWKRAAVLLVLLVTACNPLGPAPTPTLVPAQLDDPAMQQAALAAVQEYAQKLDYRYRNPSFDIIGRDATSAVVHATVSFETRKGFPYEEHDALMYMEKQGDAWVVTPIKSFAKLAWEVELTRGPSKLTSGAGFTVDIPAGWSGYAAQSKELKPAAQCGIGAEPTSSVTVLMVIPTGYSAENVPMLLRAWQQCPRAPGLAAIRQRIEAIRASDKSLSFKQLELTQLGGQPALAAVVVDENGNIAYNYYVIHRDRQLEIVLQARPGRDVTPLLNVLGSIQFN